MAKKKKKRKKAWSHNVDLEILPAVFVSTGMNRNDDVFLPEETWAARNTIINKPVNLSHDNEEIVGHIFEAYVVDQETGERFDISGEEPGDDDTLEAPLAFDIVTNSYLYRMQLRDKLEDIIEMAEAGEKFVSMEVFFSDYDYLVETAVVERNSETSFLDQALRAKGGSGEFEGRRVGRILKNMVFGGMGIVDNPANPRSVILLGPNSSPENQGLAEAQKEEGQKVEEYCVLVGDEIAVANSDNEENRMEKKIEELEAQLAAANKEIDELKHGETQKAISELKEENDALKAAVEELHETAAQKDASLGTLTEEVAAANSKIEEMGKEQEKLVARNAELEEQNVVARLEIRTQKLDDFDLSEEDRGFVLAEIREMSDEDFDTYLTRAERMWKKKVVETPVVEAEEKAEAQVEESDDAELAHAALEDAASNPENVVFNGEDDGVLHEVALAVESIWAKEG
tara:strand:- start:8116 stop:9489 length:1374 start_codon:yes stop_codon:yes gene_type:complete